MKLFAFVRRARRSPPPASTSTAPAVAPEDATAAAPAEKRRRRPFSSGSASWKPTLGAISEDAALTATSASAATKAQAKPASAAKAKARSPRRATRAASYDDFRHYGPPTVLPAFSPTAFLF
ncbi:hypothetical protein C2845_PM03G09400 [Panicum miliaceum]|uniref:Uncharacterized protein n=1 Tax=Panicum miliaceum TaxID=4540 RepID=A0A3L6TCQ9_PANMI|nr:hypothetical protein C2845_PM03G09400 [Panicum miliaceum]